MRDDSQVAAFVRAMALFAAGVALLGHGMAATVFVGRVTPVTVLLPLVGSAVAYRSLASTLPPESVLASDWTVVPLAVLTAGFVNAAVPPLYESANLVPSAARQPGYWPALLAGAAGFTAVGVHAALAPPLAGGRRATAKSLGVAAVAVLVGGSLLVGVDALALRTGVADALPALSGMSGVFPGVVGAALAAALLGDAQTA